MDAQELRKRTKNFTINCCRLILSLSKDINNPYSSQFVSSGSSLRANYTATKRRNSNADFINKLKIGSEELDEFLFFVGLIEELNKDKREKMAILYKDGDEILENNCFYLA